MCGLLIALAFGASVDAQVRFKDSLGLKGSRANTAVLPEFTVKLVPSAEKRDEVVLQISAKIPPDNYIYSTIPGNGAETKISLSKIGGLAIVDSAFQSSPEPKEVEEDVLVNDKLVEKVVGKHFNQVTWSRRFRILPNTKPEDIGIDGTVMYQICDSSTCRPNNKYEFGAKLAEVAITEARPAESTEGPVLNLPSPGQGVSVTFEHRKGIKNDGPTIGRWIAAIQPRQARPGDTITLSITANLEHGWHVYALDQAQNEDESGPLNTAILIKEHGSLLPLGTGFSAPPAVQKASEDFDGLLEKYYEGTVRWERSFKIRDDAPNGLIDLAGDVAYQTCNEGSCIIAGLSFRGPVTVGATMIDEPVILVGTGPMKTREAKELMTQAKTAPVAPTAVSRGGPQIPENVNETENLGGGRRSIGPGDAKAAPVGDRIDKSQGLFWFLIAAVGFGFAALLTPCVFPMVPITVSFFQKQSEKEHHRPVTMASVYCLGIIGTFTGLGLLMSILFGAASINNLANNPWVNLFIAGVLVFFGFNLLGLFEIRIPSWLLTYTAGQESRGGFIGVLFMALTFTLTSFTCTFAFAGGLLVAASQGDRLWPILGLLAFSAAFSTPFFFLALFPSVLKKLPKSGGWMNTIKVVMGLIEVGAAFKFLSVADLSWHPTAWVFDYELVMSAWMVISIGAGLYLLNMFRLPHDVSSDHVGVLRFMFAMSFLGLASYLAVGIYGSEKPTGKVWEVIASTAPPKFEAGIEPFGPVNKHGGIKYALDYNRAVEYAAKNNLPVFIDFTGKNCTNCRKMEKFVLSRPDIVERLKKFVCIQVFTDAPPPIDDKDLGERLLATNLRLQAWFGDISLPSYAVVPADKNLTADSGNLLATVKGYNPDETHFAKFLDDGLAKWRMVAKKNEAALLGSR